MRQFQLGLRFWLMLIRFFRFNSVEMNEINHNVLLKHFLPLKFPDWLEKTPKNCIWHQNRCQLVLAWNNCIWLGFDVSSSYLTHNQSEIEWCWHFRHYGPFTLSMIYRWTFLRGNTFYEWNENQFDQFTFTRHFWTQQK